jgi:hypothetical protein
MLAVRDPQFQVESERDLRAASGRIKNGVLRKGLVK